MLKDFLLNQVCVRLTERDIDLMFKYNEIMAQNEVLTRADLNAAFRKYFNDAIDLNRSDNNSLRGSQQNPLTLTRDQMVRQSAPVVSNPFATVGTRETL